MPPPGYCHVTYHMIARPNSPPLFACPCGVPQYDSTYTFIETASGPVNVQGPMSSPISLSFTFLHGPCHTYRPGTVSMKLEYLQGAPPWVKPYTQTHKASYGTQVLGPIHGGRRICPLQLSLLAVLYTRHHGVGGVYLLWGKGLTKVITRPKLCITYP